MARVLLTGKVEQEFLDVKKEIAEATFMKVSNPYVVAHLLAFYRAHSTDHLPVEMNSMPTAPVQHYEPMVASSPVAMSIPEPPLMPMTSSGEFEFGNMPLSMDD